MGLPSTGWWPPLFVRQNVPPSIQRAGATKTTATSFVGALLTKERLRLFICYSVENYSKRQHIEVPGPVSDPNIFHKTKGDQTDAAANRAARARTVRTAILVLVSTAIWGVMAFVLISDTGTAMLATILIGLAKL